MASYNTVPDLESEAQPLAGAPPRKHGKATLAVVAALAFGAGALAPSAAARVGLTKFDEVYQDYDNSGMLPKDNAYAGKVTEDGPPVTTPAQEPAGTPIINTEGGVETMSTDCGDASNSGGEHVDNPGCNTAASNAGKGGGDGKTYIPARK